MDRQPASSTSTVLRSVSRRGFLKTGVATTALLAAPAIVTANKSGSRKILGKGDFQYQVHHDWPQLPDRYQWQTTHNVAIDKNGFLYVIHEGHADKPDHPSIFVFDPQGRFVRAFGERFQGGGHGLEVRDEDGQEYLYVAAYQQVKAFAKLSLDGEVVWEKYAPMQSGVYAEGEDTNRRKVWGRDRFMPTNFAFLPDGSFYLADGYGSYFIHYYDKDANWKSCFGGPGDGNGTFNTPHGLWVDRRDAQHPQLVVTDRAHHTLQYLSLEGSHLRTQTGFGLPANVDTYQDLMLVPELLARVTLLDGQGNVVAHLGDDVERIKSDNGFTIRRDRQQWRDGKFVHPHDACFDQKGDIFVAEWVATGRVSKLQRLG